MNVLILCETSARTRDAFRRRGHNAISVDLLPTIGDPAFHVEADMFDVLEGRVLPGVAWDLMIAHPTCTYLCGSGIHWNKRRPERAAKTEAALVDFQRLLDVRHIPRRCIENPVGVASRLRKPTQIIQPYQFGEDASKATCLWLDGLMPLQPTMLTPRVVEWPRGSGKMVKRWGNQTDSGQNKLPPSVDRWKIRSDTYSGIADAFAAQWG